MPELPEVETLRLDLSKEVVGKKIKAVAVSNGRSVRRHASGRKPLQSRTEARGESELHHAHRALRPVTARRAKPPQGCGPLRANGSQRERCL